MRHTQYYGTHAHMHFLARLVPHSPEHQTLLPQVFSLLDMHQQLDAALPALTLSLGDAKPCKALVSELSSLRGAIAAVAASLSAEYEEAVGRDASKVVVAD